MQRILSIGCIPSLLKQRNAALTAAGLTVTEAAGLPQGLRLIDEEVFEVVVLGSGLEAEERDKLTRAIQRRKCGSKIIMLYEGRISGTEMADAIIAADDPQRLVETIQMLGGNSKSRTECA